MHDKMIQTEFLIHDLKVPIAVIEAGARLLLEQPELYGPLTDKQIKVLRRISRNAQLTRRLVNDALEQGRSRQRKICVSRVSLSSIVASVLMELFDLLDPMVSENITAAGTYADFVSAVHGSGIQLSFDERLWGAPVGLDESKTGQILRNLVSNAFKYRKNLIQISGCMDQNDMIFTIKDDGNGIPKEKQLRIFDSYLNSGLSLNDAVQSHGLGLAGVKALLKDMGGALDLDSDKGRGTCFTVRIPLKD